MKKREQFDFEKGKTYKLIAVTDKQGRDKSNSKPLYKERIGCIAVNFLKNEYPLQGDSYNLRMKFILNEKGQWINRSLYTSFVEHIEWRENRVIVHTKNSIYTFEEADMNVVSCQEQSNLIELFMSVEDDYRIGKGFYYDSQKTAHELNADVHVGMFQGSVLLYYEQENAPCEYVCRYFPTDNGIELYDTLYGQQDYTTPMHIHNTGQQALMVSFPSYGHVWTVDVGASKRIMPLLPDGMEEEDK